MGGSVPALTSRKVIRALERGGFYVQRTSGGHYILRPSQDRRLRVTVPHHTRDLKRETLRSIIRQAKLTEEQFMDLL